MTRRAGATPFSEPFAIVKRPATAAGERRSPALHAAVTGAPAATRPDSRDTARLVERFDDLSWQSVLPIATVVMTLVVGVLTCGHLLIGV